MITVVIYSHIDKNGNIQWKENDLKVYSISNDYLRKGDFEDLFEAVKIFATKNIKKEKWCHFTFKRVWENYDGIIPSESWFCLVKKSYQ